MYAVLITPSALGATPECLNARGRAIHDAAFDLDDAPLGVALHDLGEARRWARGAGGAARLAPCARDRGRSPGSARL